jgi:hypothetical protein
MASRVSSFQIVSLFSTKMSQHSDENVQVHQVALRPQQACHWRVVLGMRPLQPSWKLGLPTLSADG